MHDLNKYQIIKRFYKGVNGPTKQILDSKGPLSEKRPLESKYLIENLPKHCHNWQNPRDAPKRKNDEEDEDGKDAILAQIATLARDMKNMNQAIHAIQVGCDNCSRNHLKKDCPSDENDELKEEVAYANNWQQGGGNNRRRKPYTVYKQEQYNKCRKTKSGYYGKTLRIDQPLQEDKGSNFEAILAKFAMEADKRHQATETLVANMREQKQGSEGEIGSYSKHQPKKQSIFNQSTRELNGAIDKCYARKESRRIPKQYKNPNAQANAVSTRSGKIVSPPHVKRNPWKLLLKTKRRSMKRSKWKSHPIYRRNQQQLHPRSKSS